MQKALCLIASLALVSACESTRSNVSERDAQGNYVTTSDYESMQRAEFEVSLTEGLRDFDRRYADLRSRANQLGGDSLSEFADWSTELDSKRSTFVNELEKSRATLIDEWPDQRADTLEAYEDLRGCLDDAYDEVLD